MDTIYSNKRIQNPNTIKYFLFTLAFLFLANVGWGQATTIDFETENDGYSASETEGTSGNATDVFNRANPNIGGNSTYIWAVEDLSLPDPFITLDQIDVTGSSSFTFSIDMLTPNTEDWDVVDELLITYNVDGGAEQNLMWVQSNDDGDDHNAPAALDLGFDGTGDDGEELPAITDDFGAGVGSNFETFTTSSISLSSNTTLDITLQFNGLTSTAEGIYIDNIVITQSGSSTPTLTVSPTTLTGYTYEEGAGPSTSQNFALSGSNLDGTEVTVTAPTNYEVSLDNSSFATSQTVSYTAPTLSSTTIYVRLSSGLSENTYTGNVTCNDNGTASDVTVDLSGAVTAVGGGGCASDLIISEVNENGGDKYVEIANYTGAGVDLSIYGIVLYVNGSSTPGTEMSLTPTTLADGNVWVLANTNLSITADQTEGGFTPNGNDVIALRKSSTNIDVFGTIGSSSYFYADETHIRNSDITTPTTSYSSSYWTSSAYSGGDPGTLGSHTMDCGSSNDDDSQVSAGSGSEPATIASTIDSDGEEIMVFDFTFTDAGTADGLSTILDEIQITQGDNNDVADWTNAIAGAYLSGTDLGSDLAGTVAATTITFTSDDMISIADGGNETYSLKIYLNTDLSGVSDNDNLEFKLDYSNITTDGTGSSFGSGAPESGDANVAIDIEATQLLFVVQPTNTYVNTAMSPDPTVKACDVNGNVDVDYSTAISVASDGTMTGDPVLGTWSDGVATFSGLIHTATGITRTLTASSGALADEASENFDVTDAPSVFISEIAGDGVGGDPDDEYIELTNLGSSSLDLNGWQLLYYESSTLEKTITFGSGDAIPASDAFVIAVRTSYSSALAPDYVPSTGFHINNHCHVILKNAGGTTIDEAGSTTDQFNDENNYEFTDCGSDNGPTANWDNLGGSGVGTPGVVNCACISPSTQASNIVFSNITTTSMDISWTSGNGDAAIVLVHEGTAVDTDPVSGTSYTADNNFSGSPDEIGTGNFVVYNGTGNSFTLSGLTSATTYYAEVYEYNNEDVCYLTPGATANQMTLCGSPSTQASFDAFTNVEGTSMDVNWVRGDGDEVLIVARQGSAVSATPTDGTTYSVDAVFGSGSDIGINEYVVYKGTGTSVTVTGLAANTTYHFAAFEFNCTSGSEAYLIPGEAANETTSNYISVTSVSENLFCVTSTATPTAAVDFTYAAASSFSGSTFTAQLSDALGSFASPVAIGAVASDASGNQEISASIPASTNTGTGYRIRVVSNSPVVIGSENNSDLSIYLAPINVSALTGSGSSGEADVNWSKPAACYDEIMVVCKESASITASPSGSSYSANAAFGSGDAFDGGYVVYKGSGSSITITGLTDGNTYYVKVFTRFGSDWSSGEEISFTVTLNSNFQPGDLMLVGFDTFVTGGEDKFAILTLVDINQNTKFIIGNGMYEVGAPANTRTDRWYNCHNSTYYPSAAEITYTGSSVIPAGSVICFETTGAIDGAPYNFEINGVSSSDFTTGSPIGESDGYVNVNSTATVKEGIFLMQGTASKATDSEGCYLELTEGSVLSQLVLRTTYTPFSSAVPSFTGNDNESRKNPNSFCFSLNLTTSASEARLEYDYSFSTGTKEEIIAAITNSSNWDESTNSLTAISADLCGIGGTPPFTITTGTSYSSWTGISGDDWFDCRNWDKFHVPDEETDVVIESGTMNSPEIDHRVNTASEFDGIAQCNDLTIDGETLSIQTSSDDILEVHDDLIIKNSGVIDMSSGSGVIKVYGNWDNQVGTGGFIEGNSLVDFAGEFQNITSTGAETFYDISFSGSGTKTANVGINANSVTISSPAEFDANGNNITFTGDWTSYGEEGFDETCSSVTLNGTATQTINTTGGEIFNNLTLDNVANDIVTGDDITIDGTLVFNDDVLNISDDCLTLNGDYTRTSGTITVNSSSLFNAGGSGDLGSLYFTGGAVTLNNFTINRSSGSVTLTDDVVIEGILALTDGAIEMNNNAITLNGDLTSVSGTLTGTATSNLTINDSGALTGPLSLTTGYENLNDFTLNRASGSMNLGSDMNIDGTLTMTSGILNTGSNTITLGSSGTLTENETHYITGNIQTTRDIGSNNDVDFGGIGLVLTETVTTNNSTTVLRVTGTQLDGNSCCSEYQSIARYFDITPDDNSDLDATMVFHYLDHELNGIDDFDLVLFKASFPFGGTDDPWTRMDNSVVNTVDKTVTLTGINSMSRWTVTSDASPLPIELLSFEGRKDGSAIELNWATASEINNDYFMVNRSTDAKNFASIGKITGSGTSNAMQTYSFIDSDPVKGTNYYQLEQTDYDGRSSFSGVISVEYKENKGLELQIVDKESTVEAVINNPCKEKPVVLEIFDVTGQRVYSLPISIEQEMQKISISKDIFHKGIYMFNLRSDKSRAFKKIIF